MKRGIALLITLLFIMLITLSIGIGLKQVNDASQDVKSEKFLLQSSAVLGDVLTLLQSRKELNDMNSSEELAIFLSETSFIPFNAQEIQITLELSSARSRFNINNLKDVNNTLVPARVSSLKRYVSNYMINISYVDILLDAMSGIKEDMSYNSAVFNENPYLFRDYIASDKHFAELNDFYSSYYRDDGLKNIEFKELFYFSNNNSYTIDLNYATTEVWEMMLGCDNLRASDLSAGFYENTDNLDLNDDEKVMLKRFKTSFFEPFVDVRLNIMQDKNSASIRFEYDIKNKEGSNFVYEI